MDEDADAVEPDREQVVRLDQFEALVHHRCRIDTDLRAHRPVGMRDRLRRGDMRHRLGTESAERAAARGQGDRSEEHTSELQSLMRISYAVFCLKKKQKI